MFTKLTREQNGPFLPCEKTGACLTLNGVLSFCIVFNIVSNLVFLSQYVICLGSYAMKTKYFYCLFLFYTFEEAYINSIQLNDDGGPECLADMQTDGDRTNMVILYNNVEKVINIWLCFYFIYILLYSWTCIKGLNYLCMQRRKPKFHRLYYSSDYYAENVRKQELEFDDWNMQTRLSLESYYRYFFVLCFSLLIQTSMIVIFLLIGMTPFFKAALAALSGFFLFNLWTA